MDGWTYVLRTDFDRDRLWSAIDLKEHHGWMSLGRGVRRDIYPSRLTMKSKERHFEL